MSWKPVVVGVDMSPESWAAVTVAWTIARAANTDCHVIHVTHDVSMIPIAPLIPPSPDADELTRRITADTREHLAELLRGQIPPGALESLEVRLGHPTLGLAQAIVELDAGLLVLGGKHHSAPARWFGGSTAHHAVRKIDKPILLTVADRPRIQRVLAAVDLSHAAVPTLKAAETFARLFDAELRVLHVVEPLPSVALPYLEFDATADVQQSTDGFNELLREETDGAQGVVRLGWAPALIREFVTEWDADLLVVGSHGKGWVDRILMGSTTEKLANHLPTSLLVVHIPGPNGGA